MEVLFAILFLLLGIVSTLCACAVLHIKKEFERYKLNSSDELKKLSELNNNLSDGFKAHAKLVRDIEDLRIRINVPMKRGK